MSFNVDLGTITFFMPASIAASTLEVTPPTGKTSPRTDKDPVIAVSWLTGTCLNEDIIAVNVVVNDIVVMDLT